MRKALAPNEEPEWVARAAEINQCLREHERIMNIIESLPPDEQVRVYKDVAQDAVKSLYTEGGKLRPELQKLWDESHRENRCLK